jgi:hypothetical protein
MSYQAQAQLTQDGEFQGRVYAVGVQQADVFRNDARPAYVALATAMMGGDVEIGLTFVRMEAAGPGIADKVDNGDGTITQANVTDADLLSLTQAVWPTVANLYFNEDGSPKT